MNISMPVVTWLEENDVYREEVRKQTRRELPDVAIHFSMSVTGLWQCLHDFSPHVMIVDVMLPRIEGVRRLSEGVWVAKWIREGQMPEAAGRYLRIPKNIWSLGNCYANVPIYFVTGRSRERLESEIEDLKLTLCHVIEKAAPGGRSAADQAIKAIRQELSNHRKT